LRVPKDGSARIWEGGLNRGLSKHGGWDLIQRGRGGIYEKEKGVLSYGKKGQRKAPRGRKKEVWNRESRKKKRKGGKAAEIQRRDCSFQSNRSGVERGQALKKEDENEKGKKQAGIQRNSGVPGESGKTEN